MPARLRRTAAAALVTPGRASSALSISPSSMRRPPSLTWSSPRPAKSSPCLVVHAPGRRCGRHAPSRASGTRRTSRRPCPGRGSGPGPTPPMISSPTSPGCTCAPCSSTTARSQPSRGRPMRTGPLAVELGAAGDDGRLGGAVGVPELAARSGEPGADLGRTGLATHDQQAYGVQRLGRPQRHQRRHRRDDRDVVGDQPRPDVDPAAHQRPRRRHQAAAVGPGEPHLLARRVEGHREAGHHPVRRAERLAPGGTSATRRPRTPPPTGARPRRPSAYRSSPR